MPLRKTSEPEKPQPCKADPARVWRGLVRGVCLWVVRRVVSWGGFVGCLVGCGREVVRGVCRGVVSWGGSWGVSWRGSC
eukprot:2438830-Pyramimonas_sp.AAC.1